MVDTVIHGTVPDALRPMPDGMFQTCITSPPYWGLRDYGLDPVVWDGGLECEHECKGATECPTKIGRQGSTEYGKWPALVNGMEKPKAGSFCVHCGAWLGCLGLEPTPELYIDHLVQIFREVKRVLRDDGTLWLSIGDSYAGNVRSITRVKDCEEWDYIISLDNKSGIGAAMYLSAITDVIKHATKGATREERFRRCRNHARLTGRWRQCRLLCDTCLSDDPGHGICTERGDNEIMTPP